MKQEQNECVAKIVADFNKDLLHVTPEQVEAEIKKYTAVDANDRTVMDELMLMVYKVYGLSKENVDIYKYYLDRIRNINLELYSNTMEMEARVDYYMLNNKFPEIPIVVPNPVVINTTDSYENKDNVEEIVPVIQDGGLEQVVVAPEQAVSLIEQMPTVMVEAPVIENTTQSYEVKENTQAVVPIQDNQPIIETVAPVSDEGGSTSEFVSNVNVQAPGTINNDIDKTYNIVNNYNIGTFNQSNTNTGSKKIMVPDDDDTIPGLKPSLVQIYNNAERTSSHEKAMQRLKEERKNEGG